MMMCLDQCLCNTDDKSPTICEFLNCRFISGGGDFQGLYYDRGCMYTLGAESGNTNNNITERNTIYQRSAQFGQYV